MEAYRTERDGIARANGHEKLPLVVDKLASPILASVDDHRDRDEVA